MNKIIILFFALFLSLNVEAQSDCISKMSCKIIAPSGMRMRSEPDLKSKVVTYVPKDSLLSACTGKFGAMTYENINGFWRKVKYEGKIGYMFDGFLEIIEMETPKVETPPSPPVIKAKVDSTLADTSFKEAQIALNPEKVIEVETPIVVEKTRTVNYGLLTETYNYCGDVQNIDPGLIWYGIYPKDDDDVNQYHRIKEVEVNVILSKQKIGKQGLEFDIQTTDSERSIFLIGLNQPLATVKNSEIRDNSEILRFNSRKVFPGQQWTLIDNVKSPITLSATGSVENAGPCPDLKNYKLVLKGEKYFLPVEQDMTQEIVSKGQCGMPEVYWYGDLNGDEVPEIVFVSVYEDQNQFTLFVSDPKLDNVLVKKEAEWVLSKCY